ncbi:MAG TPA: hypothetical protein VMM76_28725 [Pirellulaceae bacterium]|nr:hypothetical protein [Pirellulaceae bacterium]
MTSQHDKPKRWRPRFSVRTLAIVVTLVCAYAACWGPTEKRGVRDVSRLAFLGTTGLSSGNAEVDAGLAEFFSASPALPLVVGIDWEFDLPPTRHYYFWFFGYVAKLPYERELPRGNPQPLDETIRKLKEEVSGRGWENHFEDTGEVLVWPYDLYTSPQDSDTTF